MMNEAATFNAFSCDCWALGVCFYNFRTRRYGIFYKRGAELSDSQAATRLMIYVALGSMLLGVLLTVGLAGDAVWAARTATSSFRPTATTTENGEKAPPPLPPRGAVAKAPSRASPYAGLGK